METGTQTMDELKMMDLPTPLIMDILSRVPPKSLLRFRCVSKSWKYLIDDSHFINLHLQHSLKNTTNLAFILRDDYVYMVEFPALAKAIVIDHPSKFIDNKTTLLGSCNGLLCLSNGEKNGKNGTILYNPVTRKSREVLASRIEFPGKVYTGYRPLVYGFGYDLLSDDYKVVRIIQFSTDDSEVKVFSLKSNVWRRVQEFPREYFISYERKGGTYVSGHLHWLVTLKNNLDGPKSIIAFDLSSEVYKNVKLPNYSVGEALVRVEVLQQCLCLVISYRAIRSEVWVMKEYGREDSWTKLFEVFDQAGVTPFVFSKDGSEVLLKQDYVDFVWYDLQNQRKKKVKAKGMPSHSHLDTMMLVESLVLGSRKTNQTKKSKEREQLGNIGTISLPNSSGIEGTSKSCLNLGREKPPIY